MTLLFVLSLMLIRFCSLACVLWLFNSFGLYFRFGCSGGLDGVFGVYVDALVLKLFLIVVLLCCGLVL